MQRFVDLYIVYQLVKRLTTPFVDTPAFKRGIIDKHGNVLRPRETLGTKEDLAAWTWLDILLNNIKRAFALVPGGQSRFLTYAAALFLMKEPITKLRESVTLSDRDLCECILGSESNQHIFEAIRMDEEGEMALPTLSVGSGQIAGLGVGPYGDPIFRPRRKRSRATAS